MVRKSSRKTLKYEKKTASQFQRVTTMGPEVRLCTYVHFSYNFFLFSLEQVPRLPYFGLH